MGGTWRLWFMLLIECRMGLDQNIKNGRAGETRTLDPLHPMQVRYQTALRPDYKSEMCTKSSDDVKLKMFR